MGSYASQELPSTEGGSYGEHVFGSANSAESIVEEVSQETSSVLIVAHPDNADRIHVGWDDQVSSSNGIPLDPGGSMTLDLDASQQRLFGIAASSNDEIRYLTVE